MKALMAWISNVLREGTKESYGRVMSIPFFLGSFGLSLADGVMSLIHKESALDAAASLTVTGMALFTVSKALHIRGQKFSGSVGGTEAPPLSDQRRSEPPAEDAA